MRPIAFAWIAIVRQPARAVLGILGVAVVGALLFDMLLLSRGLVVSFEELLDRMGFDVRVTATTALPFAGPMIGNASEAVRDALSLDEVEAAVPIRVSRAEALDDRGLYRGMIFMGLGGDPRNTWKVLEGDGLPMDDGPPELLINRNMARDFDLVPGDTVKLWGRSSGSAAALPGEEFHVVGIADFAFDARRARRVATRLADFRRLCGEDDRDRADMLLVVSSPGAAPGAAVAALRAARPDLHAFSNEEILHRFERTDFSYFRQMSFVLTTVTLFFAFLLIAALLTVSMNQRFGEVAALRALGFSRRRVAADLFCESALLVGMGGLLALPLGALFARGLDAILRSMPNIPADVHFFVYQPRALLLYAGLLVLTGFVAALYPVYLAARLPIASTLRKEVVS